MRDLGNADLGRMAFHDACGGGVVNNGGPRCACDPLQHGIVEVAWIGCGAGAVFPELAGEAAHPFAVVVDELFHVMSFVKPAQKEVLEHGVMQHHNSRPRERVLVDGPMQAVIAEMVECDVGVRRIEAHAAVAAQSLDERRRIIGHARARRRQRRKETDFH